MNAGNHCTATRRSEVFTSSVSAFNVADDQLILQLPKIFHKLKLKHLVMVKKEKKETLGTNLQEYDILYSDLSCVTMWWQGVEYFTPLPVNYSNTCRQTDRTARRGLKQLPRRNQIKMRLDLISVFLCHFFFCSSSLMTHFSVLLQERQKEGWGGC